MKSLNVIEDWITRHAASSPVQSSQQSVAMILILDLWTRASLTTVFQAVPLQSKTDDTTTSRGVGISLASNPVIRLLATH
ncbi:hypothetical protein CpipJ_CPIJ008996 [Culex quinquefasciatus]|uniref:Uncharacterized protein n=1 Tax=Culex quinquefasciatus TaxID=7176 RepID=B0WPI9_CULQU|nr:hypothetical protein CpipJ_CPIJ008996 [Culex quinquefasciatus]|eukprot:XP_001850623.1 hypothetical protein CpipJ_CPIJ008996 [Culex quinquefasciatus]